MIESRQDIQKYTKTYHITVNVIGIFYAPKDKAKVAAAMSTIGVCPGQTLASTTLWLLMYS